MSASDYTTITVTDETRRCLAVRKVRRGYPSYDRMLRDEYLDGDDE